MRLSFANNSKHWATKRLKYVSAINPSRLSGIAEDSQCVFIPMDAMNSDGTFDQSERRPLSEMKTGFTRFAKNDVIFAKITPCFENGKGALLSELESEVGFGSTEFHVLRSVEGKSIPKFLYYLTISGEFRCLGEAFMQGVAGQKRVTNRFVENYVLAIPTIDEQGTIVKYLDKKVAQVYALIEKKERMIELLKEERAAVINCAVTRGLDPKVELKDTGINWLGKVPRNWESWKMSHGFYLIGSGTTPPSDQADWYDGSIPWVTTGELRENLILDTEKKVSSDAIKKFSALKLFPKRSLVIAMYGATIGRLGLLGVDATTNQACCVLYGGKVFDIKFVFYWLQAFKETIVALATGGGQPNISQDKIRSLKIFCPITTEQARIVEFLDKKTAQIDGQIGRAEKSIKLLKEYRTALISEAVTGKINLEGIIHERRLDS